VFALTACTTAGNAVGGYLSIFLAALVHDVDTSRMNRACAVARLETHSISLEPGPRSSELAIDFRTLS
jgi:hypothetical protein